MSDYAGLSKKEKSKRQAEKQKEERHKEIASRPRCAVCGNPFIGRAIASRVTLAAGAHQTCDPARWMKAKRLMN
jgi:cytochrome c-type biogenesis protein CcmH/NrfF